MARIKADKIVEHLNREFSDALVRTIQEKVPDAHVDREDLFRAFKHHVGLKFRSWQEVPNRYVKV